LETLRARDQHGWIWLWYGDPELNRAELPILPELIHPPTSSARITYDRPIHYTRYIESILEFYHVPWVHRGRWYNELDHGAIGSVRGKSALWNLVNARRRYFKMTKVGNPRCEVHEERIDYWFDMVMENDPEHSRFPWKIVFVAPCLVYVENDLFRAGQWMTPIDDENTHVMAHWLEYAPLARAGVPRIVQGAFSKLTLLMQWLGQDAQDYRVMQGQRPRVSDVGVNHFVAADELNSRYLALRRALKRKAGPHRLEVLEGGDERDASLSVGGAS